MLRQRPPDAAPAIQATAEALPFPDGAFGAAMAVLTIHHWRDKPRGLAEMRRVTRGPILIFSGAELDTSGVQADVTVVTVPPQELSFGAVLTRLLDAHAAEYAKDKEAVDRLLAIGAHPVASGVDRSALAAWTSVCRTLLNLHEAITRN